MDNTTHLPKDFIVLSGVPASPKGKWLKQIGDHPVVWAQVKSSLAVGEGDIGSRTVTPSTWDPIHRHWFANTLEAVSFAGRSSKMWMHQYREITVAVNNAVEDEQDRKQQELDLVAVQAKANIILHGLDWEQEEKMQRKLSSKFRSVALEEWHQISGGGSRQIP